MSLVDDSPLSHKERQDTLLKEQAECHPLYYRVVSSSHKRAIVNRLRKI